MDCVVNQVIWPKYLNFGWFFQHSIIDIVLTLTFLGGDFNWCFKIGFLRRTEPKCFRSFSFHPQSFTGNPIWSVHFSHDHLILCRSFGFKSCCHGRHAKLLKSACVTVVTKAKICGKTSRHNVESKFFPKTLTFIRFTILLR